MVLATESLDLVADINRLDVENIENNFYRIMRQLSSSEMSALANGLNLSLRTLEGWRYSHTPTILSNMLAVIFWDEVGRPMVKRK